MRIEDEYMDVLQNIESVVIALYRTQDEMFDSNVMWAYEALIDWYSAENIGRKPRNLDKLSPLERDLFDSVLEICEWRLGRTEIGVEDSGSPDERPTPITVDTIILCLKRLLKSVKKANKHGGRQGYLEFISQYL